MATQHYIRKGLKIPLKGALGKAERMQSEHRRVALLAADYVGMKPRMMVAEGDTVKRGQQLFEDRKNPGVFYTAPGAGVVSAVHRGDKRALQSVVIELNPSEAKGNPTDADFQPFSSFKKQPLEAWQKDDIKALLLESGAFAAIRQRPFSIVPKPDSAPEALFITAADTAPLAPRPGQVVRGAEDDFRYGVAVLSKLCDGPTYICRDAQSSVPADVEGCELHEFIGQHPAGLVGLHIHTLRPVNRQRVVWHVGYQDVINIGRLFQSGRIDVRRKVALVGPGAKEPTLVETRLGACVRELCDGQTKAGDYRLIAGNVLHGRAVVDDRQCFLGRFHNQITVMNEDKKRRFIGWLMPGLDRFSVSRAFAASALPGANYSLSTSTHGEERPNVPIGNFEKVMPMDIMPTFLLRALAVNDLEEAEKLGCLELDEEDLALCTMVDHCKTDWGPILRSNLETIRAEG